MALNALLQLGQAAGSKFDLVGPTVDDDVRRLVMRYGREAVHEAVQRAAKRKRGRKAEADWPEIDRVLKQDARRLLEGGDPFTERTNYSIAKAYAESNPGHSHAATHRRILKKLAEKRVLFTLLNAEIIGRTEYPHTVYLSVLRRLIEVFSPDYYGDTLARCVSQIADFTAKRGPPDAAATMSEIEAGARDPVVTALLGTHRKGILGQLLD